MSDIAVLNPDEAIDLAVKILLDQGFSTLGYKSERYASWREWFDETVEEWEDDRNVLAYNEVWDELILELPKGKPFSQDGVTAMLVASQSDGLYTSSSTYFIIVSLSDGNITRYFKRSGWYNSYEGGNLSDAENSEVTPLKKAITVWKESE